MAERRLWHAAKNMPREMRDGLVFEAMKFLAQFNVAVHRTVVAAHLLSTNKFSKELLEPDGEGKTMPAWQHAFEFGTADARKLGWLEKGSGNWMLTVKGREVAKTWTATQVHEAIKKVSKTNANANRHFEVLNVKSVEDVIKMLKDHPKKPMVIMVNC